MTKPGKRLPAGIAIVAAIVLLVQAFLGGTWMGAQAAAGPRDAFGNILCMTAHSGGASHGMPQGSGYDCDCCLSGCDAATAIIPELASIVAAPVAYLRVSEGKPLATTPIRRQELEPLSPRGPPASVIVRLGTQSVLA